MKKIVIAAMLLLFGAAWWSAIHMTFARPAQYLAHLKNAQQYENKEIYYDAILEYRQALEYQPESIDIILKIADNYKALGNDQEFEEECNRAIALGGDNEQAIFLLTDYYLEEGRREDAISLLQRQLKKKKNNGAVLAKLQALAGGFRTVGGQYDYISDSCFGYMLVENSGEKGLADSNGQEVISPQYEEISLFGENDFAPVKKDGQWFYIDTNNYKRRVSEESYEFMGIANQGVIPAEKNGEYGYLDYNFQEVTEFCYEEATPFLNEIAAVKKDGKWALIGPDLKPFTDFGFDDVVKDEWGFCSRNGVVFVKIGEIYMLVDGEGIQIGTEFFESVSPFLSEQAAAVKQAGKWGYLSVDGKKVLECMYDHAKSFSDIGYAPAEKDGLWGYIKQNGDFVISPEFEDVKGFNSNGIAPVKQDNIWKLIQLDIF